MIAKEQIILTVEVPPPAVPMDYAWARVLCYFFSFVLFEIQCSSRSYFLNNHGKGFQELGLIRKPASFMTSICDERGEELLYAGVPITRVLEQGLGIGGVLGLLWFQVYLSFLVLQGVPAVGVRSLLN